MKLSRSTAQLNASNNGKHRLILVMPFFSTMFDKAQIVVTCLKTSAYQKNLESLEDMRITSVCCSTPFALRSAAESCCLRAHPAILLTRGGDHAGKKSCVRVVIKLNAENTRYVRQIQMFQLVVNLRRSPSMFRNQKMSQHHYTFSNATSARLTLL